MSCPDLYAIVCADACEARELDPMRVAAAICALGPWALQLRAKARPAEVVLAWLRELRGMTQERGVLLFCNDRADLAALAGADGVHVGQEDLPVSQVRRHFPALAVGLSTHNRGQMAEALEQRPDYVALGPVFATASKVDHDPPVGLDGLRELGALARQARVPLVAIGGISVATVGDVRAHCERVALISALLPESGAPLEEDVQRRVRALF